MIGFWLLVSSLSIGQKTFTIEELAQYNGDNGMRYIACDGLVFDVTGVAVYEPGGSYPMLVGKDITVGLAWNSYEEKWLNTHPYEVKLSPNQQKAVTSWKNFLEKKYKIVGTIIYPEAEEKLEEKQEEL
ncbi:hypothetical protein SteCoe_10598 [Stentor coeruleus]|uniref:Cytochrome b5 heme-binding domain-containing protein n=1 Tax=Stentor coeruleus TaxID=5963 RepID=A0A1R2CF80_9CILI|nr:hypothetical protein SteCoe_10598 [Stentor coeruleus]